MESDSSDSSVELLEDENTDSSEDEAQVADTNLHSESSAQQSKRLLLQEESEINAIVSEFAEEDYTQLNRYGSQYLAMANIILSKRMYQDISPLFVNGTPFILDGFSLISAVLQDSNYCLENGGQTLHFIYLCERIIELVCWNGGSCQVVFFKDKCNVLKDIPKLGLMLTVLKKHLMNNTEIIVHEISTIFSKEFVDYINEVQPAFMLVDFAMVDSFKEFISQSIARETERLFKYNILFIQALGYYCVDLCQIELRSNMIYSFVLSANIKLEEEKLRNTLLMVVSSCGGSNCTERPMSEFMKRMTSDNYKQNLKCNVEYSGIKEYVALNVATKMFLNCPKNEDIIRLYLLYYATNKCLPLARRSLKPKCFPKEFLLRSFVNEIVELTYMTLENLVEHQDCGEIADIWNGNLFQYLFCYVYILDKVKLGTKAKCIYEQMVDKFNNINGCNLDKYPIVSKCSKTEDDKDLIKLLSSKMTACERPVSVKQETKPTVINLVDHSLNDLIKLFCSDIVDVYGDCCVSELLQNTISVNERFEEKYHWHSLRPLTDDIERIKDNNVEDRKLPMFIQLRNKLKYARYMNMYGTNIEGRNLETETIIVCEENKSKNKKKKHDKIGSKGLEIIKNNVMKKQNKVRDEEKGRYNNFLKEYKLNKLQSRGFEKNYNLVNLLMLNITTDEYTSKLLFHKVEILYKLWVEEHTAVVHDSNKVLDLSHIKELFITIRMILTKKVPSLLEESVKKNVACILSHVGFSPLISKWKLPICDDKLKDKYCLSENLSYIRFQLRHIGPEIEHKTVGEVDNRVSGFVPDSWQKKLFDIIDRNESAVIVAPTSSGKTYASYYCMKKVLKESNDGVIVYVAPTKALVNQVSATVFARFHSKKMPAGKSVLGVFTRDFKINYMHCQILVTVPQCLEMLLMSPRCYKWVQSLKYVIFDEVHCLSNGSSGLGEGISLERCLTLIMCPFLALSATIEKPREFWSWLCDVQTYKKTLTPKMCSKVHLVIHSERHNDLIKHVYNEVDEEFHHIHPYAYVTKNVVKAHNGIPHHISLSPSEVLKLYDTMCQASPGNVHLLNMEPDKYFNRCDTGFISKEDVKDYENALKNVFYNEWFLNKMPLFEKTIELLNNPLRSHNCLTGDNNYFFSHLVTFIEKLRVRNMLPCIVFSYNRILCEVLASDLAEHYRTLEIENLGDKTEICKRICNVKSMQDDADTKEKKSHVKQSGYETSGKPERRKKDVSKLFPLEITSCNSLYTLRGQYHIENKDLQYIEKKLSSQYRKTSDVVDQLRRGTGVHHAGMPKQLRQTVEILFRAKFLSVVFATGTLALGIHMPCKTVVILGDSPYLNTLEYHQMSGRSGRRGYDKVGNVVFFGINTNRVKTLMTSKLPKMTGNFPLSVSTILRLLLLVTDVTKETENTKESYMTTLNRALSMLNGPLSFTTDKMMKEQMKHFLLLSCQLLMTQKLIDNKCAPMLMSGFVTHLHYHEPGNLAFVYLLRSGVISKLCAGTKEEKCDETVLLNVVNLLAILFTRRPLNEDLLKRDLKNSVVQLPPLPKFVTEVIKQYNREVEDVYKQYFKGFSQNIANTCGEDNKLPLSGMTFKGLCDADDLASRVGEDEPLEGIIASHSNQNLICSAFSGLSGISDEQLYCQDSLISNIRHQIFTDCKVLPLVDLSTPINGYAYDFFRHGIVSSIIQDNGLKVGSDYQLLFDFLLVLKTLETSLLEIGMSKSGVQLDSMLDQENLNLCVVYTFKIIRKTYENFFNKAYFGNHNVI